MSTVVFEKDQMVPMRDGVRLATDVIRTDGAPPQPVLVARVPYGKDSWFIETLQSFDLFRAVKEGYAVVIQDTRGRFGSEGDFGLNFRERTDGADTVAWAAEQPWSNGVVGTFGGSYVGMTQWMAARESPPALKAMVPGMTYSDHYEGMQYQGGVKLLHGLTWSTMVSLQDIPRRLSRGEAPPPELLAMDMVNSVGHLPLTDQPGLERVAPWYREWLDYAQPDAYWADGSPNAGYEDITVPALNIGGWYDLFLWGTLQNYLGMKARGGTEAARQHQQLVVGPWSHLNTTGDFPELQFGSAAGAGAVDITGRHLTFLNRWLKEQARTDETPADAEHQLPVHIFVMGANQWRSEEDWPLPDTKYIEYFLHSTVGANTLYGDGELSEAQPLEHASDVYLYNPLRPVPTIGGQVLIFAPNSTGPRDQRSVEERDDVLVYSTPVLDRPVEVTGHIRLKLFISSSAKDTDFTGKLVDVHPDGRAIILTEGILRARYHRSLEDPELLIPGAVYELDIDMWATSNLFLGGHRIRLEVSSSNFPRFARNTNTGGTIADETAEECQPAVNRIYHGPNHPSRLILPIIDR